MASGTGFHYVASPPIDLQIVQPYLELTLLRSAIERQKTGEIVAEIKHVRPLPSPAKVKLLRLPAGVELVEPQTIKPGDKTVTFPLRASKDALTGQYKEIAGEVTILDEGQEISQQTGSGTLRIDAERK